MITSEHINKTISAIKDWQNDEKMVIGIDGYSGVGKTTLLQALEKEFDAVIVHRDDFILPRSEFEQTFQSSQDRPRFMEYGVVNPEELLQFLARFKESNNVTTVMTRDEVSGDRSIAKDYDFSKKLMIIEGIFLFHPNQFVDKIDKKIFLEANQEAADERRRKREMERWGEDYFPDTHPDSFFRLTKIAFNNYLKKYDPASEADLVLTVN